MYARPGTNVQSEPIYTEERIRELYSKLERYCQYLSQNKWDSEDLAQETIWKAMIHYHPESDLTATLLKKMAHNLWMDQLRKRNREIIGSVPETFDDNMDQLGETADLIKEITSKLTPKQSAVFILKEAFKYRISEIADVFGMTETAVKALLNRARKRLNRAEEPPSIVTWSEEELYDWQTTLYEAVRADDPTVLIRVIPSLFPTSSQPKMMHPIRSSSSPSSSLSMAA